MKKILLGVSVLILLTGYITKQDKKPTKSQTFDYILNQIDYVYLTYNRPSSLYKNEIHSYNKSNNTITVTHSRPEYKCVYHWTFDLNDISHVVVDHNIKARNKNTIYSNVYIKFKSKSVTSINDCQPYEGINEKRTIVSGPRYDVINFGIESEQKEVIEKLAKAFRHMKQLTSPVFDPTLFDD